LYAKMTYCVKGGIRFSRLKRNNPVACWHFAMLAAVVGLPIATALFSSQLD